MSLKVNESYLYCAEDSPVISTLTKVKILHIWNFPATGKVFLTIEDLENKNKDRFGKDEAIVSTIPYTYPTAIRPLDYCTEAELAYLRKGIKYEQS